MRLLLAEDEKELSSFWPFLVISIAGILVVFALVLIFSKIAVKPFVESYEKQKRLITDASHEIKTPLTIIEANTEVLEMTGADSEWTQSIRNQIKRLSSLTQKLNHSTRKG
nr:histidine kinase dimerization/phospho-acceptor domain-containing protein [uncultured Ruminococcus sp.]